MTQGTVKETLRRLVAVQEIDVELYEYKREIKEKPLQTQQLKEQYDSKKVGLQLLETRARELELSRKSKELDLKSKEQAIVHANAQLMTLKNNKEYQAKLFEIENIKNDKSMLEDEILKQMESSEKLQLEIGREKTVLAEEEKIYLAEKEKVEAALTSVREKASALEALRREKTVGIDPAVLSMYERVIDNREGVALVPVVGNACGGCYMNMPSQMINRIKSFDQIIRCEMCARFLYSREDLV